MSTHAAQAVKNFLRLIKTKQTQGDLRAFLGLST